MDNLKLIVLIGPTAVGKTPLAIRLAEHFRTEIISADSRQVFKELKVGTARPSPEELARVKHHFVAFRHVTEGYDAGTFAIEARKVIASLFENHPKVVLCGGSGLYVQAILEGFDDLPKVHSEVRATIVSDFEAKGLDWLQQEVEKHDPDYFALVDKQNPMRLMRALEVIRITGKPFSGFRKKVKIKLPFQVVKIGLNVERETLYQRIDKRVDEMVQRGLLAEVKNLMPHRQLNALQTVGYQEFFGFLEGRYDEPEAIRLLKRNTRHYAKRQLTWFKKDKEIKWYNPDDWEGILAAATA